MTRVLERVHEGYVYPRRVNTLAQLLAEVVPRRADVLDVGSGDGRVARRLLELRPDLRVEGVDVLVRPRNAIPTTWFDGCSLPHGDASIDAVLLVDVLHHAEEPERLLHDAARVARRAVVIKDHLADGLLARPTLRLMDRVGNVRHGVALRYAYLTRREWLATFERCDLTLVHWRSSIRLYPPPLSAVFDRSLHFAAVLEPRRTNGDRRGRGEPGGEEQR